MGGPDEARDTGQPHHCQPGGRYVDSGIFRLSALGARPFPTTVEARGGGASGADDARGVVEPPCSRRRIEPVAAGFRHRHALLYFLPSTSVFNQTFLQLITRLISILY